MQNFVKDSGDGCTGDNQGSRNRLFIEFIISVFLLSSLFLHSCTTGNPKFFDKVLTNFDSSSYYISLNIKSPYYNGRALIENDDLYNFLNKTEGLSKTRYHKKMKRILLHNRYLRVDEKDISKWKFIKVKQVDSVIYAANKGVNSFIAQYFDGVVMDPGLTYDEIYAVIAQLFYWGIPLRVDPVSKQILLDD
jgi:hypothetical protein